MEEMKCRTTGGKASIFPRKSAADILSAVKGRKESHALIGKLYKEFVETEETLTKLHSCAKRSDVEMAIELVLNDGLDVNVPAERNITPLLWASTAASSLSIKTLIDLGADVNAQTFQGSSFYFSGSTALHCAIHGNNAAVVKVLLTNNVNANVPDYWGDTPLHISTREGFSNISQLLIDSGCQINARSYSGESPLHCAVHSNNLAHVELLLKNNANADVQDYSGNTPLHISSLKGFANISQLLIDSGCEINARNRSDESPLHFAVRSNNLAHVELLLKNNANADARDYAGDTPLHISSLKGFANISQLLIDSGCLINARNYSDELPLHSAVRNNNLAHVELLLKNNANADVRDYSGNTPLHISSLKGFTNISQLLIDSGCIVNGRNYRDETPLHSAVRSNNLAHVELLLKKNANGDVQDKWGDTPLHISTREGFSNISQLLIVSGCDENLKNKVGRTPLDVEPPFPGFGDLEEDKGSKEYALSEIFRHRRLLFKSRPKLSSSQPSEPQDDDENYLWMGIQNVCAPVVCEGESGFLLKKQRELSSSEEYEPGATRKRLVGRRGLSRRVSSGKDEPRMKQLTQSTLPSPILGKLKEQSSAAEGSGTLLKDRQELSSSEVSKSNIGKEKGRTPGVERRPTHASALCELM